MKRTTVYKERCANAPIESVDASIMALAEYHKARVLPLAGQSRFVKTPTSGRLEASP